MSQDQYALFLVSFVGGSSMTQNVPETYTPETFRRYAAEVLKLELGTDEEIEQLREAVNGLLAELTPLDLVELGPLDPAIRFNPGTGDQV